MPDTVPVSLLTAMALLVLNESATDDMAVPPLFAAEPQASEVAPPLLSR